jgi:hypothetical protein
LRAKSRQIVPDKEGRPIFCLFRMTSSQKRIEARAGLGCDSVSGRLGYSGGLWAVREGRWVRQASANCLSG